MLPVDAELDDKKAALDAIRQKLQGGHLAKLKPSSSVSVTVAKPAAPDDAGDKGADDASPVDAGDADDAPSADDVVKALGHDAKGNPPPEEDLADPEVMAEVAKA